MEKEFISSISCTKDDILVSIFGIGNDHDAVSSIFKILSKLDINVDIIVQNIKNKDNVDISFTVKKQEKEKIDKFAETIEKKDSGIQYKSISIDINISKIVINGIGMLSYSSMAHQIFKTLHDENISIMIISTSEIEISIIVEKSKADTAVKLLKKNFNKTLTKPL